MLEPYFTKVGLCGNHCNGDQYQVEGTNLADEAQAPAEKEEGANERLQQIVGKGHSAVGRKINEPLLPPCFTVEQDEATQNNTAHRQIDPIGAIHAHYVEDMTKVDGLRCLRKNKASSYTCYRKSTEKPEEYFAYAFAFLLHLLEELNFTDPEADQEVAESIVEAPERLQLKVHFGLHPVGAILLPYLQKCTIADGIKVVGLQGMEEPIG